MTERPTDSTLALDRDAATPDDATTLVVTSIRTALRAWMEAPSDSTHESLGVAVRDGLARWRESHAPGGARGADELADLIHSLASGRRASQRIQRVLDALGSRRPDRREAAYLRLALLGDEALACPPLPDPHRLPESDAVVWLHALAIGAPDTDNVLAFTTLYFDTRPRELWMPAARVLGRLLMWSARARDHLRPLARMMEVPREVALALGPTEPEGHVAVAETSQRLAAARATHLRRHFAYVRAVRQAADDPNVEPLPESFEALTTELQLAHAPNTLEPADASILLAGLGLLLENGARHCPRARALLAQALGDRRLRYERQTGEVLRAIHDRLVQTHSALGEPDELAQEILDWLTSPAHVDRDGGVHRVDAAMTLLETVTWLREHNRHDTIERLMDGAPRYREALRIVARGVERGDDERLARHLALLLDPVRRATTLGEALHIATVEVLALLRDEEMGAADWPSFLARAGAPAPDARPGRVLETGWMDACLRLFFAGQAPAGLLRNVPLHLEDLQRVTHALQLRSLPEHAQQASLAALPSSARHHAGLEFATPRLQVNALVRHLAVETDRALARIAVEAHGMTDSMRTREAQLRMLWSVLEDDPSQTFFEQLHDCLRGSDTPLHRLVRVLQHLDLERDRRNDARWEAEQAGDLRAAAPSRDDLEAFQRELAKVLRETARFLGHAGAERAEDTRNARTTRDARGADDTEEGVDAREGGDGGDADEPEAHARFSAFLDAGNHLLPLWDEQPPADALDAHALDRLHALETYLRSVVAWHAWIEPTRERGVASDADAREGNHQIDRFVARVDDALRALTAVQQHLTHLPAPARSPAASTLLGMRIEMPWVPQHRLERLPELAVALREAAHGLQRIEHEVPWPARETTLWIVWRMERESQTVAELAREELEARRELEASVDFALASGDTSALLQRLDLPRTGGRTERPDPIAHLDDARIQEVFWYLMDRARFGEADDLRALVRDRLQLPSRLRHLRPLLAASAAGPLLILDIGEPWNEQLASPGFTHSAAYWGLVAGCFALTFLVLYADMPQQRTTSEASRRQARRDRVAATFRLARPAVSMSVVASVVILLTLEKSSLRVTDAGDPIPFFPQLLLWTALSVVLGILLGVVLQGRSLTKRRGPSEAG